MAISTDQVKKLIIDECDALKALLLEKNESYGNSAFVPLGIFSQADPDASICIRIDDKLKRICQGTEYQGDDTIKDLIGYLILLRIWRRLQSTEKKKEEIFVPFVPRRGEIR